MRTIRSAITLLFLLVLPAAASAECPVSLAIGPRGTDGILEVTASTDGQCGGSALFIYVDGVQAASNTSCDNAATRTASCSASFRLNAACWSSGSHTVEARSYCHIQEATGCVRHEGSTAQQVEIDNTPDVELTISEPDDFGVATVTIQGSFHSPSTERQYLRLFRNGSLNDVVREVTVPEGESEMLWTFPLDLRCQTFPQRFEAVAMTCGAPASAIGGDPVPSDPTLIGYSGEQTINLDPTPSVSLQIPEPDITGQTVARMSAQFPYILPDRNYIRLYRDGNINDVVAERHVSDVREATFDVNLNYSCQYGTRRLEAAAMVCGAPRQVIGGNHVPANPELIGTSGEQVLELDARPVLEVSAGIGADGVYTAVVDFEFRHGIPGHNRLVAFSDGSSVGYWDPPVLAGTWLPRVRRYDCPQKLTVYAYNCGSFHVIGGKPHPDPYFTAVEEEPITFAEPTVSADYGEETEALTITYAFPGTTPAERRMTLFVDPGTPDEAVLAITDPTCLAASGTCTVQQPFACSSGEHTLRVEAAICTRTDEESVAVSEVQVTAEECPDQTECSCSIGGSVDPQQWSAGPSTTPSAPSTCVGAPINVGSGDVSATIPLFGIEQIAGRPLRFDLTYHSLPPRFDEAVNYPLGRGWTHSFNLSLRLIAPSRLMLHTSTGDRVFFDRAGTSDLFIAGRPSASRDRVSRQGNRYVLEFYGGGTTTFAAENGVWLASSDRHGNVITAEYDSLWNLAAIIDTAGRRIQLGYDGTRLRSISLPDGTTWRLNYDDLSNAVTAIHDPLHETVPWRTIEYVAASDARPLLTSIRDDAGFALESHTYDSEGRGITSSSGNGRDLFIVEYDTPAPLKTRVTHQIDDYTSQVSVYSLESRHGFFLPTRIDGVCSSCGGTSESQTYAYDELGRVRSRVVDGGALTTYEYDANGNVISRTEAAGTALQRTTTYRYLDPERPWFATEVSRPSSTGNGPRITESGWNEDETLLTVSEKGWLSQDAGSAAVLTTTTRFDARHRLGQIDGPRQDVADVITPDYYPDDDTDVNRRGRLRSMTDAAGLTTILDDYDIHGTPRRVTDPNGVVTRIETDDRGRVLSSTSQAMPEVPGESAEYVTRSVWDSSDRLVETESPGGLRTSFVYEAGTNRLVATIRLDSDRNEIERRLLTLDRAGNTIRDEDQLCSQPSTPCSAWVSRRTQSYLYDDDNRLAEVQYGSPDGAKTRYGYDGRGRLETVQDENHSQPNIRYTYDLLDRLTAVTQKLGSSTIVTRYDYDAQDHLVAVTDPNGNVTTYDFDDFGRMIRQTSPVTGVTTYAYDPAGNLVSTTNAEGATTTRTHDAAGRAIRSVSSRAGTPTETVIWTFDQAAPFAKGRLASMTDPTGSTHYRYDRRGLVTEERKVIRGFDYVSTFTWNADANLAASTDAGGLVSHYEYDDAGRPFSLTVGSTAIVTSTTYLPFGPMTSMTLGNGLEKKMSYDARYRLTALDAGPEIALRYAHDPAGNILSISDTVDPGRSRSFGYDDLHRLTRADGGARLWGAGTYSYDAMGNLRTASLGEAATTFTYNGSTPKLLEVVEGGAARSVTYDTAGNELLAKGVTHAYSARNHLATAGGIPFVYDGRGVATIAGVPYRIVSFTVDSAAVAAGATVNATLTLSAPAVNGLVISVSSDSEAVSVPASVSFESGTVVAVFPIETAAVAELTAATLTATLGDSTAAVSIVVEPARLESLALVPATLSGSETAVGTVTLTGLAPDGGITVTLASLDPSHVTVPSLVVVPAGGQRASFDIATQPVAVPTDVVIRASSRDTTTEAILTLLPPVLTHFTLEPAVLSGGETTTAEAALSSPAAAAGASVEIESTDPALVPFPAPLLIAPGATIGQTSVVTHPVSVATPVVLSATYQGITRSATLTLEPPAVTIAALAINPAAMVGSHDALGTLTLTHPAPAGGIEVDLATSDGAVARVPAVVVVPEGDLQVAFVVTTRVVAGDASITITALHAATVLTAELTVLAPAGNYLAALAATATHAVGGMELEGRLTLALPSDENGGSTVMVSASDATIVAVPPSVRVKRNQTSASFQIATRSVVSPVPVVIIASHGGVIQRLTLTVTPPHGVTLAGLTLDPSRVVGGGTSRGTVTLTGPAPPGGLQVALGSQRRNLVSVPAGVFVPEGASAASFPIATGVVHGRNERSVELTASDGTISRAATLVVAPQPDQAAAAHTPVARCATAALASCLTQTGLEPILTADAASPSLERYYFYSANLELVGETAATPQPAKPIAWHYVWFNGQPVAQIETSTGAVRWYVTDPLGTPFAMADSAGAIIWRNDESPYGEQQSISTGETLHQPLRFPGQFEVEGTGLRNNVFRWYRAGWGRYTQADPIGESVIRLKVSTALRAVASQRALASLHASGSLNTYSYADQSPTMRADPRGLAVQRVGCDGVPGPCEDRARRECCRCHDSCFFMFDCAAGRDWPRTIEYLASSVIRPATLPAPCVTCNLWTLACFGATTTPAEAILARLPVDAIRSGMRCPWPPQPGTWGTDWWP